MRILVTGATGFIGRHVLNRLAKHKNIDVVATSIDPMENISQLEWINDVEYFSQNLNEEKENYFNFFKKPDILIHLAWEGLPNYKKLFHIERNLFKNYSFIKNMTKNGLKNLNVVGTCLEYGMRCGCVSEEMIANPITPYAIAKDTLRKYIKELKTISKFKFKWIRLFYMYGKGQNPNSLIPQLDKALDNNEEIFDMSGGEQLRDYLPVEKVAEFIIKISLQNNIEGIINCCSGNPISVRKMVEDHLKKRNKKIKLNLGYYPYPDYESMAFWGDNTKLKQILALYNRGD